MELVDFLVLETKARKGVWVQVPPSGPYLLLDILLVVCYTLFMILWEDGRVLDWSFLDKTCLVCGCNLGLSKKSKRTKCESCKKKELDKNKKEEYNYFEEFVKNSKLIVESAEILKETIVNYSEEKLEENISKVHKLENEADKTLHNMRNYLIKDFLPPIDREDIVLIGHRLDDIEDFIDEILINFNIFSQI